ncbi:hypothetical protein [Streptomyces sp. ISL-66]|nr:hypothetical protein [Streptomyces sp. ISL-66]
MSDSIPGLREQSGMFFGSLSYAGHLTLAGKLSDQLNGFWG